MRYSQINLSQNWIVSVEPFCIKDASTKTEDTPDQSCAILAAIIHEIQRAFTCLRFSAMLAHWWRLVSRTGMAGLHRRAGASHHLCPGHGVAFGGARDRW